MFSDNKIELISPETMKRFGGSRQRLAASLIVVLVLLIGCLCFNELASATQLSNGPSAPSNYNNNLGKLTSIMRMIGSGTIITLIRICGRFMAMAGERFLENTSAL